MTYIILIIVAIIISLLAWFVRPDYFSSFSDYVSNTTEILTSSDSAIMRPVSLTRDIARSTDMSALQGALLQYKIEKNVYPASLSVLVPDFIPEVPADPQKNEPYKYEQLDKGNSYELCMLCEKGDKKDNPCVSSG